MKIRQKQWQLYYLGYYGDSSSDIDGIWGQWSGAGTRAFQERYGLIPVDGVMGTHTANKSREVISAVQAALRDRVDRSLKVDGLAGPKTMRVTEQFQRLCGIEPTGLAGADTLEEIQKAGEMEVRTSGGAFWEEIEYFTREELKCKCGGKYCDGFPAEPKEMVVRLADRARRHFGRPARNVSFLRCRQHNVNCGGVANSQHMYGEAMDISIDGVTANALYGFLRRQPEVRYTYKINNSSVHFDIPKGKR